MTDYASCAKGKREGTQDSLPGSQRVTVRGGYFLFEVSPDTKDVEEFTSCQRELSRQRTQHLGRSAGRGERG